jgi:uncharacterized protein (TIGR04255 family)
VAAPIPTTRPKFSHPPVVEVAATLGYQEINPQLLATNFETLRSHIGTDYKIVEFRHEMPETLGFRLEEVNASSPFEFPKYWFMTEDKVDLLQLSHRRLAFNWRRIKPEDQTTYKTYDHVWKRFSDGIAALERFQLSKSQPKLTPVSMELAYFNHIRFDEFGGSLTRIEQLFPSHEWLKNAPWLEEPNGFSFLWNIPDPKANRNIRIQCVTAVDVSIGDPILRLDIVVHGNVPAEGGKNRDDGLQKWYDEAHLIIVNTFATMTADKVQRETWGKS